MVKCPINKLISGQLNRKPLTRDYIDKVSKINKEKRRDEIIQFKKYYHMGCAICGENRAVEICHVVPISKGGSNEIYNLIMLCPTHHAIFDKNKLNDYEFDKIANKLEIAYKYEGVYNTVRKREASDSDDWRDNWYEKVDSDRVFKIFN